VIVSICEVCGRPDTNHSTTLDHPFGLRADGKNWWCPTCGEERVRSEIRASGKCLACGTKTVVNVDGKLNRAADTSKERPKP